MTTSFTPRTLYLSVFTYPLSLSFTRQDDSERSQRLITEFRNISDNLLLYTMFGATDSFFQVFPPIQLPFVIRMEDGVDPMYYRGDLQGEEVLSDWIRQRTLPLLPEVPLSSLALRIVPWKSVQRYCSEWEADLPSRGELRVPPRPQPDGRNQAYFVIASIACTIDASV